MSTTFYSSTLLKRKIIKIDPWNGMCFFQQIIHRSSHEGYETKIAPQKDLVNLLKKVDTKILINLFHFQKN